jgi:HlyD family secretion protein
MKIRNTKTLLRTGPVLVMLLALIGCSSPQSAPTQDEAISESSRQTSDVVSATGEVVPARWASLSFPIAGQTVEILVKEGDEIQEDDVVARLDSTDLDIALIRAEAALQISAANLALSKAGPREQEVERAKDQLAAANARISVAVAQREQVKEGPSETDVINAQTDLEAAQNAQESAQEGYDTIIGYLDDIEDMDLEPGARTPLDGEQNARYSLELANLRLAAAQAYLNELLDGPDPDDLNVANARVWLAVAQRDASQAYLDLVMAGTHPADIAISEAEVEQAQAAVNTARIAREQTILRAPFSGTVSDIAVNIGEMVSPGQTAVTIADLSSLQVETTDLNELDVARITVGSPVTVTFDALPGVEIQGSVAEIASKSAEGAGVNYTVTIELNEIPEALRWGMTAFVDIKAE